MPQIVTPEQLQDIQDRARLVGVPTALGADWSAYTRKVPLVVAHGNPVPWERAGNPTGSSKHYTPTKTRVAEQTLALQMLPLRAHRGEPHAGNLALAVLFYRSTRHTVDKDNLLKLVMDAGTKARVWRDDSQITAGAQIIELDRKHPRTVIALAPHSSTLTRS